MPVSFFDPQRNLWGHGLPRWVVCGLLVGLLTGCGTAVRHPPVGGAEPSQTPAQRVEPMAPESSVAVALQAMGLVGTPYRFGGNNPEAGFDCSGLIAYVHREAAGVVSPRTVSELSSWGMEVPQDARRTGDVVVFTVKGRTSHAGVYVGSGRFVHAPSTGGTVRMDRLDSGYWARQVVQYRRP